MIKPIKYIIEGTDTRIIKGQSVQHHSYSIYIDHRGNDTWAVVSSIGNVLKKSGYWEWEPQPSSRTDEFIKETRFGSPEEAYAAYLARKED